MSCATSGVRQNADPRDSRTHLYGLTPERWQRLSSRSFWITGAGTGFGRALAVALASSGARLFLSGRRREKLDESLREMSEYGVDSSRCHLLPLDLTNSDEIAEALAQIERHCQSLHGLINNAAMPQRGSSSWPLQEESGEYWDQIFALNVRAQWEISKLAMPHMIKGREIRVLFISSAAGWGFAPGFGHYNVTKAAINSLAANMAAECAARYPDVDVQINILDPGEARTEMNQGSNLSPYTVASMALMLMSHPAGGPNGKFFHRDGRHLEFGFSPAYHRPLIE